MSEIKFIVRDRRVVTIEYWPLSFPQLYPTVPEVVEPEFEH